MVDMFDADETQFFCHAMHVVNIIGKLFLRFCVSAFLPHVSLGRRF